METQEPEEQLPIDPAQLDLEDLIHEIENGNTNN